MAADQELKYKITTTADTAGADTATKSVERLDRATKETGKSAADTAKNLNQTGEVAEKLRGGAAAVQEVLRGNLRALGQFPAVLKAIAASVSANPLFALGTVIGLVLVPALQKLKDGWAEAAKASKDAVKAGAEAADEARRLIATKQNNALAEQLREIERSADAARRKIEELANAQAALVDAEEAVSLAQIDADKSLSEVDRLKRRAEVQSGARDRRYFLQVDAIDQTASSRREELRRLQEQLPERDAAVSRAQRRVDQVGARSPDAIRRELDAADASARDRLPLLREASRNVFASSEKREGFAAEAEQIERRLSDLRKELADAEQKYAGELGRAEKALADATASREETAQKEAEMRRANEEADASDAIRLRVLRAQRSSTTQVEEIQRPDQLREAAERDREAAERRRAERGNINMLTGDRIGSGAGASVQGADKVESAARSIPAVQAVDLSPLASAINGLSTSLAKSAAQTQAEVRALASSVAEVARAQERLSARVENISASSQ